jgi:glycosyltransferase involved in cell wall biosynthesis
LEKFQPAAQEPDNPELLLLVIASVQARKNGLCLIKGLSIARERYNLFPKVNWVGQRVYNGEPYKYLVEMERAIVENHLETQWNWMDQRLDIVDLLHQHDALVHPSYKEGLPNVVCEALACARPVIVSNTLEHPYLVQDGISGYLFDFRNPADLAEKICKFSKLSADERHEMGIAGRKFAVQNLSLEKMTKEYKTLFLAILNGNMKS